MCQALSQVLGVHFLIHCYEADSRIIILISLLKKLRHREVDKIAQVQVACMRESQDLNPDSNPVLP